MVSAPVLTLLDGNKPFTVYTGTCEAGLGAVFDARGKGDMQKVVGTQLGLSIAYHPQTDGRTERVNRILEDPFEVIYPRFWRDMRRAPSICGVRLYQ